MEYKVKTDEENRTFVFVTKQDGTRQSFEALNENKYYISFLRQLSEENPNDPHYLAWVEAGNNPDDFWTRDLDSPEGLEPSEPKEEKEETPQEGEG